MKIFDEILRRPTSDKFVNFVAGMQNGSAGAPSASLMLLRERVAKCEAELESARAAMRAAAAKLDIPRSNLFSESVFIKRSSAEKWVDEAERRGRERGFEETVAVYHMLFSPPSPEIKALADATRQAIARGELKGFFGIPRGDGSNNADLASQILAAAARRDSDPSGERPEPQGLAGAVIRAGKKRRELGGK